MSQLEIKSTGEIISLVKSSISTDLEQFVWSLSAEVATKDLLKKLIPPANLGENYIEVRYTVGASVWEMIIEDTDCNDSNFDYTITGKSKPIILAEPYAAPVTQTWLNSSAQAICTELCTTAGITLNWQILNWNIPLLKVEKRYPADIISELVREIGAKLQSLPDGSLSVIYYPASNPQDLAAAPPLYQIDTARNVFERAEKFINRENWDCVFVTKDGTLLEPPTVAIEEISDGDERVLYVYPNPFIPYDVLNLQHASLGYANLFYEGTFTERQIDDLVIEGGEARLSKNFDSLVGVKWHQTEVGTLTIAGNGRVSCEQGDTGLLTVTYNARFLRYRAQRVSNIAKTMLFSDELPVPVLTTGLRPAPPIVVNTLSTPAALAARVNAELWSYYDTKEYNLEVAFEGTALACGKVAKVNVIREADGFNVWVKAVTVNSTGSEVSQQIKVERPLL